MPETIRIQTRQRNELVEITDRVAGIVAGKGWTDGAIAVYTPHTTAGICINENADPDVRRDVAAFLERLIPQDAGFAHVERNSDSHIKAILTGSSALVLVEAGRLLLGRWQGLYLAEFDGPRTREIWLKMLAGA